MVANGNEGGTREHAVVIAGGGPTGMALAAELTLGGVDAVVVERRRSHELESSRAGGLHARTIEVFDQRGVAERFLVAGEVMQIVGYSQIPLDLSDFPSRHPYGLALWQSHIERIMGEWIAERDIDAIVVGRHPDDLTPALQRDAELGDPLAHDPLDVALPQRQAVRVTGREVADVERDLAVPDDLHHLAGGEEPLGDAALVEDLDRAGV